MKEDFVGYYLAVKLKEKGFKEECIAYYFNGEFIYNISQFRGACVESLLVSYNSLSQTDNIYENYNKCIDAPSVSQVLKWLREEKNLYIRIELCKGIYFYNVFDTIEYLEDWTHKSYCIGENGYESYEESCLSAINYVLDNLI